MSYTPYDDDDRQYIQELLATYRIGETAEEFKASDMGRYLLGMAEKEGMAAAREIAEVPLHDTARLAKLQARIARLHDMERWVTEAIERGHEAQQQLAAIQAANTE